MINNGTTDTTLSIPIEAGNKTEEDVMTPCYMKTKSGTMVQFLIEISNNHIRVLSKKIKQKAKSNSTYSS